MEIQYKNKKKYLIYVAALLLVASAFSACDKKTVYHKFQTLPQEGWRQQDTLLFNVSVPDSQTYYKFSVEIRHRNEYPYRNIGLSVFYNFPEHKKVSVDTLEITLADEQGRWKGEGWGGLYQSAFFVKNIKIERTGNYLFQISQTLPDETLPGVNDIGIKLERLQP